MLKDGIEIARDFLGRDADGERLTYVETKLVCATAVDLLNERDRLQSERDEAQRARDNERADLYGRIAKAEARAERAEAERDRLAGVVTQIQPPSDIGDNCTAELAVKCAELEAERDRLDEELATWRESTGLLVGGDPDGVTPEMMRAEWDKDIARTAEAPEPRGISRGTRLPTTDGEAVIKNICDEPNTGLCWVQLRGCEFRLPIALLKPWESAPAPSPAPCEACERVRDRLHNYAEDRYLSPGHPAYLHAGIKAELLKIAALSGTPDEDDRYEK